MANQKVFQPMMSQAATPTYIQQGVADTSEAVRISGQTELIKDFGKMAVDAWKGYETARLEAKDEETMSAYLKGDVEHFRPGYTEQVNDARMGVFEQEQLLETQWQSPDVTYEGVSATEKRLVASQQRLATALEQGTITSDEFNARMTSNLREAVNRAPGFAQEFIGHTKKLMELSGMSDFMRLAASQQAMQKKQAEQLMQIQVAAIKEANINPADYGNDINVAGRVAHKILQEQGEVKRTLDQLKVLNEQGQLNRQIVDQLVGSPEWGRSQQVAQVMLNQTIGNNLGSGAYLANKAPGMDDVSATVVGIQRDVSEHRTILTGMLARSSEASRPALNAYLKQLDTIESTYIDIAQGKYDAAEKQNRLQAASAAAKLPFAKGDALAEYMNKLSSMAMNFKNSTGRFPEINQPFLNSITRYIEDQQRFIEGYQEPPLATVDTSSKQGQMVIGTVFSLVVPDKAVGQGYDEVIKTNSTAVTKNIQSMSAITDREQFTKVTDLYADMVNATARSSGKAINQFVDGEASSKLVNLFESSMGSVARQGVVEYNPATNKLEVRDKNGVALKVPTERFNRLFRAANSVRGYALDADIDQYGQELVRIAQQLTGEKPIEERQVPQSPTKELPTTRSAKERQFRGEQIQSGVETLERYVGLRKPDGTR